MSILKTFGKVARIIIGLVFLLIGSCTIIFGAGNQGLETIGDLAIMASFGLLGAVFIIVGIKKLRDPTLEKHYASMSPEDIEKEKKKSRRNSIGCLITIVVIIIICGVTFWALESQTDLKNQEAMSKMQNVSESFTVGGPIYKFELPLSPVVGLFFSFMDENNNNCLDVYFMYHDRFSTDINGKEEIITGDFRKYLENNLDLVVSCNLMEIHTFALPPARTEISLKLDYVNGRVTKVNNITSNLTD